ncbi:MAG: phage head closure protein [Peptococcia bacterium]
MLAGKLNHIIELGNTSETVIKGEPIKTTTKWRKVFASKKSVRQSEFYQAENVGLKPELIFEVRSIEFNNDEKVRHNGVEYAIIRAYDAGDRTELTVSSHVGGEV